MTWDFVDSTIHDDGTYTVVVRVNGALETITFPSVPFYIDGAIRRALEARHGNNHQ